MLIDSKMVAFEDQAFTSHVSKGNIDLGGADRGTGTTLLVHAIISPSGTGAVNPPTSGSFTVTVKTATSAPGTATVIAGTFLATAVAAGDGLHAVFALPYDTLLQHITIEVDDTSLTGTGSTGTATAFVFVQ